MLPTYSRVEVLEQSLTAREGGGADGGREVEREGKRVSIRDKKKVRR